MNSYDYYDQNMISEMLDFFDQIRIVFLNIYDYQ